MTYFQLITGGVESERSVRYFTEEQQNDAAERFAEAVAEGMKDKTPMGSWVRLSRMPDEFTLQEWHQTEEPPVAGSIEPPV